MSILFAAICGLIQGLAEFLPISSSGHLALFHNIFGAMDPESVVSFDVLLHMGTLLAVFVVFYKDIFPLIPAFFTMLGKLFRGKFKMTEYNANERMVIAVVLGCIPLVIGAVLSDYVTAVSSYTWAIGIFLVINAVVLFVSDSLAKGGVNADNVKPKNAIIVGLCQLVAVLPGISRSGSTITGGLTQRFDREFAVKYSFILSIPAILGAFVLDISDMKAIPQTDVLPYIVGTVVAFVSGICAMKLLVYISRKANFRAFSYYCAVVGVLAIIFGVCGIKIPVNF